MMLRRTVLLGVLALGFWVPRPAFAKPEYLWQFAEWREQDLTGGLKLVPEPFQDRRGGYVIDIWDLLGPTVFGDDATLSVAGYNEGNTFFAHAQSPIAGGVAGNTVGGDAFIQVKKRYHKDSDVSALRFTYSAARLEVMDFGSGEPPWKAPYAQITMEVDVFQDGVGYVWGLTQTALARSDVGIDLYDLADDTWVLDVTGETRGPHAQVIDRTPRWQWDCETCTDPAYGFHRAKLRGPYTQDIDLSGVGRDARFTIYFALTVRAVDPSQGETSAYAFARYPLSGEELTDDAVRFESEELTELDIPRCDEPGLAGVACLLDTGLPPESCTDDELPGGFDRHIARARALVSKALEETNAKKLRKLVKSLRGKLEKADRSVRKRESAKRGAKPSPACAADIHGVLGEALGLLDAAVCDPAAGVLRFGAPTYEASEADGAVTLEVLRTGGSTGPLTATVSPSRGIAGATPGLDYARPSSAVTFDDGDVGPHAITVPIIDDRSGEPDESVTLTLSPPGECGTGGAGSSTVLTIIDDDHGTIAPPAETYTVGGTVSGLLGAGLELVEIDSGARVSPGNGPFAFGARFADGSTYEVRVATQPSNPTQICTLTDHTGAIAASDVTDVVVTCATPMPGGGLDPTFGGGGLVTGTLPGDARALVVQNDGKILVLGARALTRFDADGAVDPTFATGGTATVGFGGGLSVEARDLALQPDGRIVVAGSTGAKFGSPTDFAVARYLADGTPDPSFGAGGVVVTDWHGTTDRAYAVLIQDDGKIVVAGHAGTPPTSATGNDYAVARYTSTGELDASFGTGGKAETNVAGRTDLAYAAALQPDGAIVLAGRAGVDGAADPDVGIVRYRGDGSLDATFGSSGVVLIDVSGGSWDEASDVAVTSDGAILVAVQALVGATFDYALARFRADGALDTAFGTHGVTTTAFAAGDDYARAMSLRPDGRIVVVGQASSATGSDFGVARYHADGSPDTTFGNGGQLAVDFFGKADGAGCVVTRADGAILVGGLASNGSGSGFGLVRIVP